MNRSIVTSAPDGYSTLDDLMAVLMEFNGQLPRPGLGPLVLSHEVSLTSKDEYWPHATLPGVYVMYTVKHRLVYIGKASLGSTMGVRLHSHLQKVNAANAEPQWRDAAFARSIPLPRAHAFEAAAIEEYMLGRLRTTANIISGIYLPDEAESQ